MVCVIEVGSKTVDDAVAILKQQHRNDTQILSVMGEYVILANPTSEGVVSAMCHTDAYPHNMVVNAHWVPTQAFIPQPPMPVDHPAIMKAILKTQPLQSNPIIEGLIGQYSRDSVTTFVQEMSTDKEGANTQVTRNSYSISIGRGGCANGDWFCAMDGVEYVTSKLNEYFKEYSGEWNIELHEFRSDMCPNIVLTFGSDTAPSGTYVVSGAHLDSRNTGSGSTATGAAPGADDNGTGSAVLLEMARIVGTNNIEFENQVQFQWYCGEEQGLLGSAALANRHRDRGDTIIGMFNNDMIGYTNPSDGPTLSFMTGSATAWLSATCKEFSGIYVPSLPVGDTRVCCSDQQSFFSRGFPAAGIFETPTAGVAYPQYHRTGDTFDNGLINYQQVWQFGQANFACMMEFAVPVAK